MDEVNFNKRRLAIIKEKTTYISPYITTMELARKCGINVLNNREDDFQEYLLKDITEWGYINIKTDTIITEEIINDFKEAIYWYIPVMYIIQINNKIIN